MKINTNRLLYSWISVSFFITLIVIAIYGASIFVAIHGNNNSAFAIASNDRHGALIEDSLIPSTDSASDISYHETAPSTIAMASFHQISFADDTMFPQTFQSSGTSSNDITLSNGNTLPARPITLTVNKIQANNTLVLTLHSFNDKYLLTADLRGPAKPTANSNADSAQFALTGSIIINKNTTYPVSATLSEDKGKQVTLSIAESKSPTNFKITLDFSPPHGEQPLAGI
ncbi:MAG TPA: hypothetical protein VJ729_00105 [Nitrososphaeraceae archaeon]|nr:hypothetical protein [Nitrososphaeraceae archaeon]